MTDAPTPGAPPAPPTNAAEASARLGALRQDKDWTDKLLAGGIQETAEWKDLHSLIATGDKVDMAIAGGAPDIQDGIIPDSSAVLMSNVAADLLEKGLSPTQIRVLLSEQKIPQSERDLVAALKGQKMRDGEFTKRYPLGRPPGDQGNDHHQHRNVLGH
jgi:hypothetical protein